MPEPAKLVQDARLAAGLTQAELAVRLGVTQSAIAKLERDSANPSVATLDRVLRATGHRLQLLAAPWGGIDTTLIRRQLALRPDERIAALEPFYEQARQLAAAGPAAARWPEFRPRQLLAALVSAAVDFVVVGGVAVVTLGYGRLTRNLDLYCAPDRPNRERTRRTLAALGPSAPVILTEPAGAPPYAELRARALIVELDGMRIAVASLEDTLAMKRASGRPADLVDIEALELIQRRRARGVDPRGE